MEKNMETTMLGLGFRVGVIYWIMEKTIETAKLL